LYTRIGASSPAKKIRKPFGKKKGSLRPVLEGGGKKL